MFILMQGEITASLTNCSLCNLSILKNSVAYSCVRWYVLFILLFLHFQSLALLGCLCGISSCLVMQFDIYFPVHTSAVLLGITQATLLITSLSSVAKLIRQDTVSH